MIITDGVAIEETTPAPSRPPRRLPFAIELLAAIVTAVVVAVVGMTVMSSVRWPAYTTSHVLRALTTVGQVAAIAVLAAAITVARRTRHDLVAKALSWVGISGLVTVTLAVPLAATRLYLGGLSPDQQWRSRLLAQGDDPGAPWSWLGGRIAATARVPGWEFLAPYAVCSLAVAAVVATVWWSRLARVDQGVFVAACTVVAALGVSAADPTFAITLMLLPVWLAQAWTGARSPSPSRIGVLVVTAALIVLVAVPLAPGGLSGPAWAAARVVAAAVAAVVVWKVAAALARRRVDHRGFDRVVAVLAVVAAVEVCQAVPDLLAAQIAAAYTDTDGRGVRADGYPASAVARYREIDETIRAATGDRPRRDVVVLTGDASLLAVYPYSGFLAQSARYTDTADWDARFDLVRAWAASAGPTQFLAALDRSPFPPPRVFVLRRSGGDYVLRVADDSHADHRTYTTITFAPDLFADNSFEHVDVGAFTILTRR